MMHGCRVCGVAVFSGFEVNYFHGNGAFICYAHDLCVNALLERLSKYVEVGEVIRYSSGYTPIVEYNFRTLSDAVRSAKSHSDIYATFGLSARLCQTRISEDIRERKIDKSHLDSTRARQAQKR